MTSKLLAFFLMTSLAFGQAVCVTNQNNVGMPLGPLQHPAIGLERGTELRHNNYAFDGSGPIDLGASFVRYEIVSGPTMSISKTNVTYSATVIGPGLTQVIITPSVPAGVYYTRFIQYQANNSNYVRTLSWDTLIVTNPVSAPSAGATYPVSLSLVPLLPSNGTVGTIAQPWGEVNAQTARVEKLIAADLDVSGAITAIDTGRVSKLGDTMTGPLTNAHGYYGWAGALTGLNWSAISNAPVIPDLADVVTNRGATINGEPITNGAAITVAQSNVGTLQLYTNAVGEIVFTNTAGYQIPVAEVLAGESPDIVHHYNSDAEITTNLNLGTCTYIVTNGHLVANLPNESGSLRLLDYNTITTGQWVRAAIFVKQGALRTIYSASQQVLYGIGWKRTDGTNYLWGFDCSGANAPLARLVEFTALYARVYPWINGVAAYDTFTVSKPAHTVGAGPNDCYYAVDYDGTNVLRGYYGYSKDYLQLVHVATSTVVTATQIAGLGVALFSYAAGTGGSTNSQMVVSSLEIEHGKLWRSQW